MDQPIRVIEEKYLKKTLKAIKTAIAHTKAAIKQSNKNINDAAKGWDDVRIKTDTYSGIIETAMSVRQQQQLLAERENSKSRSQQRYETLVKQIKKPYFARIDFKEKNGEDTPSETIYIGLASFSDDDNNFLVYDWRTPVASIYYDGGIGDVEYLTPAGPQEAEVTLKRQFEIEDGVIVTLFDTEEAIGDAMLVNALAGESSTKMKSIVTTIQKEQNKIIRDTEADLLFVQGAAGSGKTAAIMQRVAYLLYRYRGKLTSGQVVLFSPNQLFNDYVDQVLPELGEQNLVQMTFYQYASRRLPRFQVENLNQRFEDQGKNPKIDQLMGSLAMYQAINTYANSLNQGGIRLRNLMFHGESLIRKEKIAEIYYHYNQNYRLSQRLEATQESLMRSLRSQVGVQIRQDWVEEAIENLSKQEYDDLVGAGRSRLGDDQEGDAAAKTRINQLGQGLQEREFSSDKAERHFLGKQIVTRELRPLARKIRRAAFLNINAQFVDFLNQVPDYLDLTQFNLSVAEWHEYVQKVIASLKNGEISLASATVYLYLYDLVTGKHGQRDIRFLFIDEIQDYTPLQLAFLKFSFPLAKFTVLGDLNQAIFTHENAQDLQDDFSQLFDGDKVHRVELNQTYRSTQQITDFTKAILKDGQRIEAFDRKGEKPVIKLYADNQEALVALRHQLSQNQADRESTAVITESLADARQLTEQLQDTDITLIHSENQRLVTGAIILPSYLAKGLEFDAVIIWQADAQHYHSENQRQLLYTVASRAMHRLTLIGTGTMSPLLTDLPQDLYQEE
ncbi:RNA polymerase recycling motor HelD [Convivina intestini]|uniref:DNA helicase-2/ATP-dependent DNA helicase PcrA n=1 Tax=Convivina intestini TaxID=1505726 RepID=A0A2U1D7W4_9LACO|nr:RNA polymerase recycling motor HelD [Convivina intestini]PVY83783.1 DNA helicase-2/ATP-dependent DNA helicase PcrA [Convivina intestini]CAH1854782.1 DNA helicase IV [Convivina intestini]SDB93123.1 DNA helicase-2 / ATP-dependent DNA helicase PcrA [Leuconostocaceae bacterium R-53105]